MLEEASHLLVNTIRIFAGYCCFLYKSFNPLHYEDFELASATAGYFCSSVCAKCWWVLSERLKQRCHGYPRPISSQSIYRTQTLITNEKEFLMASLTWIQMVHNTFVLPQLKLHPEKAPPVSQQPSVCLLSLLSLTFWLFCSSQFLLVTILHIMSHSWRSILEMTKAVWDAW